MHVAACLFPENSARVPSDRILNAKEIFSTIARQGENEAKVIRNAFIAMCSPEGLPQPELCCGAHRRYHDNAGLAKGILHSVDKHLRTRKDQRIVSGALWTHPY